MASYSQSKASKLWSVRFREIGEDGHTHNMRLSGYKTKREATEGYNEYLTEKKKKDDIKSAENGEARKETLMMDTLIEMWLDNQKKRQKESGFYETTGRVNNHIRPEFSGKSVEEIKPITVLTYQNKLLGKYSYKYTTTLMSILHSILDYAYKYFDIPNACDKVDKPRRTTPKREMQFWTKDEFHDFIGACDDRRYHAYFLFLYICGCRKGEALALSWDDIDLESGTVRIGKSVTRKVERGERYKVTSPKNESSNRTIDIPGNLCRELSDYREWQKANYESHDFVFCGERPLADRTTDRMFESLCKKAGVKKIRLHDLRHSCASLLISEGVSIVAVSKRLGHKTVEQTLNTYAHMMPKDNERILSVLNEI